MIDFVPSDLDSPPVRNICIGLGSIDGASAIIIFSAFRNEFLAIERPYHICSRSTIKHPFLIIQVSIYW